MRAQMLTQLDKVWKTTWGSSEPVFARHDIVDPLFDLAPEVQLTTEESHAYASPDYMPGSQGRKIPDRLLWPYAQLPCLLHRYGSEFGPCPCAGLQCGEAEGIWCIDSVNEKGEQQISQVSTPQGAGKSAGYATLDDHGRPTCAIQEMVWSFG